MKVILAGFNLDYETIREWGEARPEVGNLTPETVAAAYARISRSPKPVQELRAVARREVERARQSNRSIVFEMGHSSIAEHAVFNIDVLGVSRLLVEEIEKFRLCSYTEKSQRYVLFGDDFTIPEEIRDSRLEKPYVGMIREQYRFYRRLYERLRPFIFERNADIGRDPANRSTLEGWAKEDARYIIPLATETQLGMTVNARNLELMLRRLAAHPLIEAKQCSRRLYEAAKNVAPSLIRYTEATPYDLQTRAALREEVSQRTAGLESGESGRRKEDREPVKLIRATPGSDERVLAALIHASSNLPFSRCLRIARRMDGSEKESLMKTALRNLSPHDAVLREFEHADLVFELVVSASCFAQLKRHRMATLTGQEYDPALGITVPPAVAAVGLEGAFREIVARTDDLHGDLKETAPAAAAYILTNAHRRRVALKVNARELYHIARLRADGYAQWDIRETAVRMIERARKAMPLTLMLAAGKDAFAERYGRTFPGESSVS
ncbi:MAG: FAD-dependent thymidylate synthase [Deltaproteobacteria bacterium]|nr:FAD-dependent thymidylate synthase [Deltaproteobacteria bacterium]